MSKRPEYIACIQLSQGKSLCGYAKGFDWMLVDLEHAEGLAPSGSRLVPCEDCLEIARKESEDD